MKTIKKKQLPNKHLSQNFLINENIKRRIISSCQINKEETILEIGAGEGALTKLLAQEANKVIAIETDKSLVKKLTSAFKDSNVEILHQDILKLNFKNLPSDIKIIGNLPYNISTPIITKVLQNKNIFTKAYFTVQLEFGKRLAASVNTKNYGSFSCYAQYHSNINLLFKIPNTAFWPAPKVQSCFLELSPKNDQNLTLKEEILLFKIINEAFNQRRKKILNSLSLFKSKEEWIQIFKRLNIKSDSRAENISLESFMNIAKEITTS